MIKVDNLNYNKTKNDIGIRSCLVPSLCLVSPVGLENYGCWQLHWKNYIENFSIRNYLKKDILNFLFSLDTIPQSFSYFFKIKNLINLLLQALIEVSQSNIFFVFFFYTWSFKFNSIFIVIRIYFWSVSSILISSFSSSSFSFESLLLYLIKVLATDLPVAKIFMENTRHCVFYCITTGSGNSYVISII